MVNHTLSKILQLGFEPLFFLQKLLEQGYQVAGYFELPIGIYSAEATLHLQNFKKQSL